MVQLGIITDSGEQTTTDVISREASINSEPTGEFSPSVVQRIKFDNKGQMSRITTECGESENRREADEKPKITVEGILVEDEIGPMRDLKSTENFTFVSDIFSGPVIVERLAITQSEDLLYLQKSGGEKELAFDFQMQLKQP